MAHNHTFRSVIEKGNLQRSCSPHGESGEFRGLFIFRVSPPVEPVLFIGRLCKPMIINH